MLKLSTFAIKKISQIFAFQGLNKDYEEFNKVVKPDGINIDYNIEPQWAKDNLNDVVIQGGAKSKNFTKIKE